MGVAIAIFLLVLPLVVNNGLSHQYVSNSSLDRFNNYTGVTLSYYAAIFGGFVGGIFTYAGVKLSLDKQDHLVKYEAESHRNMLLLQLKYSYDAIDALNRINADRIKLPSLVFDKSWYTHLPYIECLDQRDLELIAEWFNELQGLEDLLKDSETKDLSIEFILKYAAVAPHVRPLIDKIKFYNP